jgi:hypothetical protein
MKSAYFTIHPGENPLPQNGCRLKSVFKKKRKKKHRFLILRFPNSTFSQNQSATITLNTGSPRTLVKILVILNATGYMFTSSSGFAFIHFEVYSTHSSKTTGNSPEISTFNRWLFLKLNRRFICNKSPVLPGQLPVSNWEVYLILRKIQHQFNL